MIRVGTAGWSYPDWEGIVYPKGWAASSEALSLLARLFDTLEINVTFYRPPNRRMAESWVRRAASSRFRFTAKLWQGFTHRRGERHEAEEAAFREGIAPLQESGLLGVLLIQFPQSFKYVTENRAYMEGLLDRFASYPLVVELRHASWMNDDLIAMLDRRRVGFCNVDQPAIGAAVPPTTIMTAGPGYVRLHGRNRENWFRKDAGRDARYDYLYSHEEIRGWVERIKMMQAKGAGRQGGSDIFIIANNHYRGQAPANALELMSLLTGKPVEVPEGLVRTYPRLAGIAAAGRRAAPGGQGTLPL